MAAKGGGFILTHYTDFNGKQWTREEVIDKVDKALDGQGMTVAQLSQKVKIKIASLYNILDHLIKNQVISKERLNTSKKFIFRKVQECMLASIFLPSPEQIAKQFKVIDIKKVRVEDGTSKGFGRKTVDAFGNHHLNSVYWNGVD